ncbi:hypothetical protein BN1723_018488 [Verticillium longisporum]|uniref:Uncharacterized protein n=1 Tax=Verticillium longisporum TaxID=100787 RepID=A0A0G4MEA2_VERLO|nr:hypothetical protein BN1723_018488 [Verticillium longisporum]
MSACTSSTRATLTSCTR